MPEYPTHWGRDDVNTHGHVFVFGTPAIKTEAPEPISDMSSIDGYFAGSRLRLDLASTSSTDVHKYGVM